LDIVVDGGLNEFLHALRNGVFDAIDHHNDVPDRADSGEILNLPDQSRLHRRLASIRFSYDHHADGGGGAWFLKASQLELALLLQAFERGKNERELFLVADDVHDGG